jgi:hypothetical protein
MKIGLLIIATGKYKFFFDKLYKAIMENFLQNHEKIIFYFTDSNEDESKKYKNLVQLKIKRLGFPGDTLYRYKRFNEFRQEILETNVDYIYYLDVDMDIIDNVGEEIIPPNTKTLTAVFHPGYYRDREKPKPHESRKESSFYVPEHKRLVYIAGGFQGGKTKEYLDVTREISRKIDKDIKRNLMPVWHDESAWNHYLINNVKKFHVVNSSYCYPENADFRTYRGIKNLSPKIIALNKDHNYFRN